MVKNKMMNSCLRIAYYNLNMFLAMSGAAVIIVIQLGKQFKWAIISQLCSPSVVLCNVVVVASLAVGVGIQAIFIIPSRVPLLFFLHGAQAAILSAVYLSTDVIILSTKKLITERIYNGLEEGLIDYLTDAHATFPADFDTMQVLGQCCGLHNFTDYPIDKVPESCCKESIHCAFENAEELYEEGCYTKILENYEIIMTYFLIIIVLVPFIISLMSCFFAFEFKKQKITRRLNHNSIA